VRKSENFVTFFVPGLFRPAGGIHFRAADHESVVSLANLVLYRQLHSLQPGEGGQISTQNWLKLKALFNNVIFQPQK
jgi:hypothetical protein